jgi:hypothetical protein
LEKRYKVIKKLGGGAFGEIFKGKFRLRFPSLLSRPIKLLFLLLLSDEQLSKIQLAVTI